MAKVIAVCTSKNKGERKQDVRVGKLVVGQGIEGDAHLGYGHRQVSLLAMESIAKMQAKGLDVHPGDFAENLTTEGIDLPSLPIGTRLQVGNENVLRVTQIGKECHTRCAIFYQAGDCVMPREGIFVEVLAGGTVATGQELRVVPSYRIGVLTASDKGARGQRQDASGPLVQEILAPLGDVVANQVIADERGEITAALCDWSDRQALDLIVTTGGTGFSPRDITPEATLDAIDRQVPGIPELMRARSSTKTPRAMLSRAVAGIRGRTLIINLPGSPRGVRENLAVVLPTLGHALEILTGRGDECATN